MFSHSFFHRHVLDFRTSRPEVYLNKDVLKYLAKFTRKRFCQSLFFHKGASWYNQSFSDHVSRVLSCPTCIKCLRVLRFYVLYVLACPTCLRTFMPLPRTCLHFFKVLEYLQKTETLKIIFFLIRVLVLDWSKGKICFLLNIMLINVIQAFYVSLCFFALTFLTFLKSLDKVSLLFNMTSD